MLRLINERLAKSLHLHDSEELVDSGAYGYVLLVDLIKRRIEKRVILASAGWARGF